MKILLTIINKLLSFIPFLAAYKAGKDKKSAEGYSDFVEAIQEARDIDSRLSDDNYAERVRKEFENRK